MSTPREPWDDDSDSDFESAASFELDDVSPTRPDADHRAILDRDATLPFAVDADDDFHECVDGMFLDDGYLT